jgi:hypothetical protein
MTGIALQPAQAAAFDRCQPRRLGAKACIHAIFCSTQTEL